MSFTHKVPTKRTTSPKGLVRQTLALPIPKFNLQDIADKAREAFAPGGVRVPP